MKLLVFTQKIDLNDTVLSFFHRWVIELAKHFEQVTVICLYEGKHELPANVRLYSLGKENGQSRFKYLTNFYRHIFKLRHDYDAVFVHMNQEYVLLGGIIWRSIGKRIYMWRNHYAGSFLTDMASAFCTKMFCTSKYSYTAKYRKTVFMPVGIDTDLFSARASTVRQPMSILSLGRIAPSKKLDQLIEALGILKKEGIGFSASIVGDPLPQDAEYFVSLKERVSELRIEGPIRFNPGMPYDQTPSAYAANCLFVNLSPSGMLDKTIFEAMSCGTLAITCNKDLAEKIPPEYIFSEDDVIGLGARIGNLLALSADDREVRGRILRKFTEENHSLSMLGSRLAKEMDR